MMVQVGKGKKQPMNKQKGMGKGKSKLGTSDLKPTGGGGKGRHLVPLQSDQTLEEKLPDISRREQEAKGE